MKVQPSHPAHAVVDDVTTRTAPVAIPPPAPGRAPHLIPGLSSPATCADVRRGGPGGPTTAAALTKTNGPDNSDATIGGQLLDADPTITAAAEGAIPGEHEAAGVNEEERIEVLGDSAYGTGDLLDKINKAGWKATIKPHPLRPAVEGEFTLDDFTYDEQAGALTCPNQVTRRLSKTRSATFGKVCAGCPLRERCTTSARGRKIVLGAHGGAAAGTGSGRNNRSSSRPTGRNGRWSSAASPGSPAGTVGSATAVWSRTTPGSTTVSPG